MARRTVNLDRLDDAAIFPDAFLQEAALAIVKELQLRSHNEHERMITANKDGRLDGWERVCKGRYEKFVEAAKALQAVPPKFVK